MFFGIGVVSVAGLKVGFDKVIKMVWLTTRNEDVRFRESIVVLKVKYLHSLADLTNTRITTAYEMVNSTHDKIYVGCSGYSKPFFLPI